MKRTRNLTLLLTSAVFVTLTTHAFALDGTDMMTKLNAAISASGREITFDKVKVDGDTVTVSGVEVGADNLQLGDVTFEGVNESEDGGYYAKTVSFPDVEINEEGVKFSIKDIVIQGLSIPADASGETISNILLYEVASSGQVVLNVDGKDIFSIKTIKSSLGHRRDGFTYDTNASGINVDLTQFEEPAQKDAIERLGLSSVAGGLSMKGRWEMESGRVAVDEYAFDFEKIGRLNLSVDFSGCTLPSIRSLQKALKAAEANPDKEDADEAESRAVRSLLQQLTFNSASIRFDDNTITKKALDYAGGQQGMTGDQMAQALRASVPVMMAQLNIPALQSQVSAAINSYLNAPKSFTIRAMPEKPVPFPAIMAATVLDPARVLGLAAGNRLAGASRDAMNQSVGDAISSLLGVKVTAND
ncbi:hypothetical protein [Rhizobium sp. LEGMi135b]